MFHGFYYAQNYEINHNARTSNVILSGSIQCLLRINNNRKLIKEIFLLGEVFMKTYLVTGGAGFIGSNFVVYMLEKYRDIKIINLDKLTYAGSLENLKSIEDNENHMFIKGDICDKELVEELFNKYDIDYVVNFAAESHVDRSISEPEIFAKTNVLGTVNLLNAAKNSWGIEEGFKSGKKYLQVSTDEVYGSLGETGYFTETTPLDPHSPYSASKAGADLMVKAYADTYKMPVNITRCSNNYGPYQFPEKLIPLLINNCLNHKPLPIYGDGMNIRDWLYVEDHCKAIDMVIRRGKSGEVYNVGGHNERTNIHIVKTIIAYLKENVDKEISEDLIKYVEDRKGHDRRYGIDPTKIKEDLGWYPETTFEVGIVKTIDWYLENKDWMTNITSGQYEEYYEKMYENK
jgi:dTDP-glucose 4,6-dehydratase